VLHKSNGTQGLLKTHFGTIFEMAFSPSNPSKLISIGTDGYCIVWKLTEESNNVGYLSSDSISHSIILTLQNPAANFTHVAWYPNSETHFLLHTQNAVYTLNLGLIDESSSMTMIDSCDAVSLVFEANEVAVSHSS
jgi:WD40 repeat protein